MLFQKVEILNKILIGNVNKIKRINNYLVKLIKKKRKVININIQDERKNIEKYIDGKRIIQVQY